MMRLLKEKSISKAAADKLQTKELSGKIVRGVLCNQDKPEFTALYQQVIERAQQSNSIKDINS